jgi:uncharacterized protein
MRFNRTFLAWCRTIHIYLTMLGLLVMLLFGITGFTANHEDWFGATQPQTTITKGKTPIELIKKQDDLRIVEHLRSTFRISGAVTGYDDLGETLAIGFKSPSQIWEVEIVKADGGTSVALDSYNFIALINNLHRGRYSGAAWRWIIDITAILITVASFTGVVLWLAMPRRRRLGIAALVLGTLAVAALYLALVPGSDQRSQLEMPNAAATANDSP